MTRRTYLIKIIKGEAVDNPMYTGLDECTKENVDKCVSRLIRFSEI